MATSSSAAERLTWRRRLLLAVRAVPWHSALPWLYVTHALLISSFFLPNLRDINPFDEAVYIQLGRRMVEGTRLPFYADNPFATLLYGLPYLLVRLSPYWLIHVSMAARLVVFTALWWGLYALARRCASLAPPLIALGFFAVSPLIFQLYFFSTDAIFAALSLLGLWQVLGYYHDRRLWHISAASLCVGLSALSRSDGLPLWAIFLAIICLLSVRRPRLGMALLAAILPFAIVVGGYLACFRAVHGDLELGMWSRSYLAFEQGEGVVHPERYGSNPMVEGQADARKLYGTPQENGYSILTAIRRNPEAFLARVATMFGRLPIVYREAYEDGLGLVFGLLALRGGLELALRRRWGLLGILLLWPLHLLTYFVTFFRSGYLLLPFFIVLLLAGFGLAAAVDGSRRPVERLVWTAVLLAGACVGIWHHLPVTFGAALILLAALWSAWIALDNRPQPKAAVQPLVLGLLVAVLLFVQTDHRLPKWRTLGVAPDEKASLFLRDNLPPGVSVGAYSPAAVWMANKEYQGLYDTSRLDPVCLSSGEECVRWLARSDVRALYADDQLRRTPLWSLLQPEIGRNLILVYSASSPGLPDVQVLSVQRPP